MEIDEKTTEAEGGPEILPEVPSTGLPMATGRDVYQAVTDRVIAALEAGHIPWSGGWASYGTGMPQNIVTKSRYKGINVILCWLAAWEHSFTSNHWVTARWVFDEGKKKGIRLRKLPGSEDGKTGQKVTTIVYYGEGKKTIETPDGGTDEDSFRFLKSYSVFNLDQLDNVPDEWLDLIPPTADVDRTRDEVDDYVERTGARILYGGARACYSLSLDEVRIPHYLDFLKAGRDGALARFNGTRFHELVHWTGSADRLHRLGEAMESRGGYAREELVAEMGAAFLSARFGYDTITRHAGYLQGWLAALRNDKRLIVKAASDATKAVEFLDALQPQPKEQADA